MNGPKDMGGPKSLDDIVPASRGVKKRPKKPKPKAQPPEYLQRPKIQRDIMPAPRGEIDPPTEEAVRVMRRNNQAQGRLMESMKAINRLMGSTVLPENRSVQQEQEEKVSVGELVAAAMAMEKLSPGEGILAMATLAVRQGLSLRDAGNRLAYRLAEMEKRLVDAEAKLDKENDGQGS